MKGRETQPQVSGRCLASSFAVNKHASRDVIAALGPKHAEGHADEQGSEVRTEHSAESLQQEKMDTAGCRDSLAHIDCDGESCPCTLTLNDTWRSQPGLLACDPTGVKYIPNWVWSQSDCG